ncbi:hypothetical protein HAX54_045885, partial [Datura stramonium]|nr:hypothetical protein [Datura stramonium]
GDIGVHCDALGMMTIGYSSVGSTEMLIQCRFELILASSHRFDPTLHQRFADRDRRLTTLSFLEYLLPQFIVAHRRFSGGPRISSCGSP